MIHNIISVTFYQTVTFKETSINGRKAFNTIDNVLLPGVRLSREGESVVIEHDDFESSYCVGMANVRHYRFEKVLENDMLPESYLAEQRKAEALERNKNNPADLSTNDSSDLVNSSQYENTANKAFDDAAKKEKDEIFERQVVAIAKSQKKIVKKKAKKKTKKKVSKKCTPKKKKNS